jgi:MFS family permease
VTAITQQEKKQDAPIFSANASAIALSSAIGALSGFIGVYLPLYFVQIGGSTITLGLFAFAAALMQLFFLPIGGIIADGYGRRKIIVSIAFVGVIFPVFYALTQDWRVFGLLTVLAAVSVISSPATQAAIVDSISPEKRTTGITAIQVVSTLPAVVSPSLGGWLVLQYGLEDGFRMACVYAAVIAFVSALPLLVLLKETLKTRNIQEAAKSPLRDGVLMLTKSSFRNLPQSLKFLMISYALVAFANGAVGRFYILYASSVVGLTAFDWGAVVSLQLLAASVIKIPGGWFSDKFGKKKAMTASLLATIPMILIFTLSQSFIQVLIAALLLVIAGIYYAPAHEALQADLTPRLMRGRVNAAWDMSSYFAIGLGTLVGGFAYQSLGPAVPFYVFAVAEFAAALLLISKVKEPEIREA